MKDTFPHMDKVWNVSLHGGHSRAFCDHASSTLDEIVEAAIAAGCSLYGITEHAPRFQSGHLYDEERAMGWTVETLGRLFAEYAETVDRLQTRFADRITLVKGFEAEVVPEDTYADLMLGLRQRFNFQYMVGSVHWVAGHIIDYRKDHFEQAAAACGSIEALAVRYYDTVAEMVRRLRPEIAGHLDIICRYAPSEASVSTPRAREAAFGALDVLSEHGCIIDINTGGYRKGFGRPFPAAWLVEAARDRGIPFCFGDDSHRVSEVCANIPGARLYLLKCGVEAITVLRPEGNALARTQVPLT